MQAALNISIEDVIRIFDMMSLDEMGKIRVFAGVPGRPGNRVKDMK